MAPLVGEYRSTLDQKSRLIVPHKLRAMGGTPESPCSTFVLAPGPEKCVFAYTLAGWEEVAGIIGRSGQLPGQSLRDLQRRMGAQVDYVECDLQGRIVLPTELKEHALLKRDVVWIGAFNRAEIWDVEAWTWYQKLNPKSFRELFDDVAGQSAGNAPPGGPPRQ